MHRKIEIERACLENNAEPPQRVTWPPVDVMAEHMDAAMPCCEQMTDQGEQCRLAGAIQAEQHGKPARALWKT